MRQQERPARRFPSGEMVDFVIVGSGAAGGIMAKELAVAGHTVLVLEQGPRLTVPEYDHDEMAFFILGSRTNAASGQPQMFRPTPSDAWQQATPLLYGRTVGGSNAHFTANMWRMRPSDFNEGSVHGTVSGTGLVDWPLTYDDLEPYYTKADWELGISGAPGPFDPPRSRPYPMPPLPVKSSGVLFERGARSLGLHPEPTPMAINSQPYNGRAPCQHCGWCLGFFCEFGAKSTSMVAMLPVAEATGNCEIRPDSYVAKVETNEAGRATGVTYFDGDRNEHFQPARAVVLCANGAETPRLLLNSSTTRFPDGLANSSGVVGKYLMFNGNWGVSGLFEHPLNEYKSVQTTRMVLDYYETDPARGFYGGGGIDARFQQYPIIWALAGLPPETPTWGAEFKRTLADYYNRTMFLAVHTTSLPVESNSIELDPQLKDAWGLPCMRVTYRDHDDDMKMGQFLVDRASEILDAAGAQRRWAIPVGPQTLSVHLLGTCRMGRDAATSVIDTNHRTHDVPNLFICDGSSLVTSTRGQPTMTISALAFRAGERIADLARRGEI
jgi:choline dehydrogenase-like flavoprotein